MTLIKVLAFIGTAFFFRLCVMEPYLVSGSEMAPTLFDGDYLFVQKYAYKIPSHKPQRGDVILLKAPYPPHPLILKRVMALPEDRLMYSKGVLYINETAYPPAPPRILSPNLLDATDFPGEKENKDQYIVWQESLETITYPILLKKDQSTFGPYKIPKDHYFVMGDHRSYSRDSRHWIFGSSKAQGEVVFYRKNPENKTVIIIPKGTILRSNQEDPHFPLFFETMELVELRGSSVSVSVQAQASGSNSHIPAQTSLEMAEPLAKQITARSRTQFSGGKDQNFIHLQAVQGKAWRVLFGCKKHFYKICWPNAFRKGRWFQRVHKKQQVKTSEKK